MKVGDSEAWCGVNFIIAIMRPFTAGEDAVSTWMNNQDDTRLLDIVPMSDGRDYIILERQHTKQSYRDALREQERHIHALVRLERTQHGTIPRQHDTPDR